MDAPGSARGKRFEMELKMVSTAVVVLSEGNNPRLLNPDFLERNRIVSAEWKAQDVVVTPPFAQVVYENGVHFVVEINKFQVQVSKPAALEWKKDLPDMTTAYLQLLPHVTYRAVGINFVFITHVFSGSPITKLLQDGPWLASEGGVTGATIEFHYTKRVPQFNVKIALQEPPDLTTGKGNGVILTVNYHRDFAADEAQARAAYIQGMGLLESRFLDFAESLPFD